jgi:hypothetical protein
MVIMGCGLKLTAKRGLYVSEFSRMIEAEEKKPELYDVTLLDIRSGEATPRPKQYILLLPSCES